MSVVFNRFFGTAINASYGIAMQVAGNVQFLAQAILNAMSPQIVKTESGKDRQSMLRMAEVASKYSFLMIAMIGIPIIFEMPEILRIWLKDVPDYAIVFCRFILLASICDQITIGLGTANQAIGDIRNYSLVINTIKLITILVSSLLLYCGYSVTVVMWSYLIIECICAIARLPFLKCTAGLSIRQKVQVSCPAWKKVFGLFFDTYSQLSAMASSSAFHSASLSSCASERACARAYSA